MHNKILKVILGLVMLLPVSVYAQDNSSLNTFSPYTFYGLGDLEQPVSAATRSMGGIGVAYRSRFEVNQHNPAAYSLATPQSALFMFGMSGKNDYLKTTTAKTAHNTFNFSDIAFQIPLATGVGFAISVTPYSTVGYNTQYQETDPEIITDVGYVQYSYQGDGNVSRMKAGVGAILFKGFSVGADLIYYMGTINRYSQTQITSTTSESYSNITITSKEEVSDISFGLGFQYDIWRTPKHILTLGATYQPQVTLNNKHTRQLTASGTTDSISYQESRNHMKLPQRIAGGIYFQTNKFGVGLDYTMQDWKNAFRIPDQDINRMSLTNTQSINFGMHYTPNRLDIRSFWKRWTYRAGFRYTDQYMVRDGYKGHDMAISFGVGIPIRMASVSELSVGVELGERGKVGLTPHNLQLVQDKYFRISVGFSLFGEDYWFVKQKYD